MDRTDGGAIAVVLVAATVTVALVTNAHVAAFGLSRTTGTILLAIWLLALLVGAFVLHERAASALAYLLAGAVFLVVLRRAAGAEVPSAIGTAFLLVVPVAIFAAVYVRRSYGVEPSPSGGAVVVGCLLLVGAAVVGYDVTGGDVTYDVEIENETTLEFYEDGDGSVYTQRQIVGTIAVRNEFRFPRRQDPPLFDACVAGDDEDLIEDVSLTHLTPVRILGDELEGHESGTIEIVADVDVTRDPGEPVVLPIERGTDCDVERDRPTLILSERS